MQPHRKRQWCIAQLTANFLCEMERVLDVYALPYDERFPVLCFDEQPCFLIGDVMAPVPMEPGRVAKEDYEYRRFGSCAVLLAVEPKTGRRFAKVCARQEYTAFMEDLERAYPAAVQITLLQDNLNTHHGGSFYKFMAPQAAHRLVGRFESVYTPKHASWLNRAELEFSALQQQCLNRRIPTLEQLRSEVEAWVAARERAGVTLNGQFSTQVARRTLGRHYEAIHIK
ncbi:IS630 family transposase [Deinococcus cavernae]|uniref:IS630 family transposase n=1 Tax=Deinococcus cavernae TaxID=2320857 RepID=A0A418V084_9DEIO|nr:IS630 family transposase [Deinococcus cavernae]